MASAQVSFPAASQSRQGWLGYLASTPVYFAESMFHSATGAQRKRDATPFIKGNFAPVPDEVHVEDLPVVGALPEDLSGCFLRTGPNPSFTPMGAYHWFDGDGMVHACRIKDGKVSYSNRWVQTSRLQQERENGWAAFAKIGDLQGVSGLVALGMGAVKRMLGVISSADGQGTGNTALVYHANRLLALQEADMPYALRLACEGIIETVSRVTYKGHHNKSFTAHPKVDPVTKKLHCFNYCFDRAPYLTYFVIGPDGEMEMSVPITIEKPVMMHDFAITENYAIFLDVPLVFDPKIMIKESKLPFVFDHERGTRFGLRRFDAAPDEEAVRWFTVPSCMIFHVANAFEDGDKVHLFACAFQEFDLNLDQQMSVDSTARNPFLVHYVFNLVDGSATATTLTATPSDFPQVEQSLLGRPNRFVYSAMISEGTDRVGKDKGIIMPGIAKYDLLARGTEAGQDACCGIIKYGPGRTGGEAIFVKRQGGVKEDDGYLLALVYDENTDKSDFVVYDASTMSDQPLATVHLPRRVPYGFHALFISEEQVQGQAW